MACRGFARRVYKTIAAANEPSQIDVRFFWSLWRQILRVRASNRRLDEFAHILSGDVVPEPK